jgi:2-oxoglutarate ferredoxin oxidoreductase subunit beta
MTGGQASPTTPLGARATTAPFGAIDPVFDICKLAGAAGASFVGRVSVHTPIPMDKMIERALAKPGFSLVEIISPCPTGFGRRNRIRTGAELFQWQKDNTVPLKKAEKMSEEELRGKIVSGVFVDDDRPEYTAEYQRLMDRVSEPAAAGGGKS